MLKVTKDGKTLCYYTAKAYRGHQRVIAGDIVESAELIISGETREEDGAVFNSIPFDYRITIKFQRNFDVGRNAWTPYYAPQIQDLRMDLTCGKVVFTVLDKLHAAFKANDKISCDLARMILACQALKLDCSIPNGWDR